MTIAVNFEKYLTWWRKERKIEIENSRVLFEML
jgi:hypothetical protein